MEKDTKSINPKSINEQKIKRVMSPAISFMSVKDERKCLNQIRKCEDQIDNEYKLWNGIKAVDFALMYTLSHHLKRKTKGKPHTQLISLTEKIIDSLVTSNIESDKKK